MKVTDYIDKIKKAIADAKAQHGDDAPKKECVIPLSAFESIIVHYEKQIVDLKKERDAAIAAAALMKQPKDRGPMEGLFDDILGGGMFGKK